MLCFNSFYIFIPLGQQSHHVGSEVGGKVHFLARFGVLEAQCAGVQRLSWTNGKAVAYKTVVSAALCASQNLVAPIALVVEQGVANVLHVHTYLVCAARFEHTLHKGYVAITLQHLIVCHGMLAYARRGVEHGHACGRAGYALCCPQCGPRHQPSCPTPRHCSGGVWSC